jgi:hypothetical protein
VNLLEIAPVRSAEWEEIDGRVVIERPRPLAPGLRAPLQWLGFLMSTRRIKLDALGSYAWARLDGAHSVAELAEAMRREFGAEVEPAEERLGTLIRQLRSQDMVIYPGWDPDGAGGAAA